MKKGSNCSQALLTSEFAAQSPKDLEKYFRVRRRICFFQGLIEDAMNHDNLTSF